ncbi:metallophosphoesterase [Cognatishimia maritima]|uniref:Calcineurin-like phosphoesterase n=1 Tax=Cognatishimia maritima TaxID=870908 RepID=A0A1M5JL54_9RHOB|nr:metallophosphoesterase [Cognatishimia maritima]SHG41261.1 hypothetical protein SAMN04488044_0702 [Cognatishimia maritima]
MLKSIVTSAVLAVCATVATAEPFKFVVLGDAPYGKPEDVFAPFEALIKQINERDPALIIHVGDTKSGSTLCDKAMLDAQLGFLNSFKAPTLYSPGDNEWTDCHRAMAGKFDPLERLDYIRSNYYTEPSKSFGMMKADIVSQADAGYPENTRLQIQDVMFVATHVVGSNNNFEIRELSAAEEFFARNAANIAWLEESFAAADGTEAFVLAIHADMFEFDFALPWDAEGFLRHSGFKSFAEKLMELSNAYGKPVMLTYGDSHKFRMFRPFPTKAPMIMAVETFGSKNMHALEITVDTNASYPFSVAPLINQAIAKQPAG